MILTVVTQMKPITRDELRSLRTAKREAEIKELIRQYTAAIRAHVVDMAKHGWKNHTHFWIVDEVTAATELRHVTGLFYPWSSRYMQSASDLRKRRPIPEEYIGEIMSFMEAQFPDCLIERIQNFLFISW